MENVRLRTTSKGSESLPPGFSIEAFRDGQLGLYMARTPGNSNEYAWYIKGIFPGNVTRSEIVSRAWELQEMLTADRPVR